MKPYLSLALILALATFADGAPLAKRLAPDPVPPVIHDGVKYLAPNDNGREGIVEARKADTGEKLWEVVVSTIKIDPKMEEDVQWVFITRLELSGDKLLVTNEHGEHYALDLKTRKVERVASQAPTKGVVEATSAFAIDLYHQLAKENEGKNLFFSPYSISAALAMTMEGARGQTMQEMGQVLRFPNAAQTVGDDPQRVPWQTSMIHAGFGTLDAQFNRNDKPYALAVANALWSDRTMPLRPEFVKAIDDAYRTGAVVAMDFKGDPEGSRNHINGWVEDQTNHRISNLIPPDEITPATRLVLTNAIAFKGDWATKFEKINTSVRDFTRADGSTVKTPIMAADLPGRIASVALPENKYMQLLELPYKGDELSMVLISGGSVTPLSVIEKHLTAESLGRWTGALHNFHAPLPVSMPKFKLESKYKLNHTLGTLGMPTAFSPGKADFTGVSESHGKGLFISAVLHKGFVEVSEEGTEAAAATAVVMSRESLGSPSFDGTRPFLYLIRDMKTGTILFLGRMMDPTAK